MAALETRFREAREMHRERLRVATEDSLQILPKLLRGQVMKLLSKR